MVTHTMETAEYVSLKKEVRHIRILFYIMTALALASMGNFLLVFSYLYRLASE